MSESITVDIGDLCTHCGRDTSFGAVDDNGEQLLLFVNRIPSGADGKLALSNIIDELTSMATEIDGKLLTNWITVTLLPNLLIDVTVEGYMCADCQSVECDRCGETTLDYEILDLPIPELLCENCTSQKGVSDE